MKYHFINYIGLLLLSAFTLGCNSQKESQQNEKKIDYQALKLELESIYDRDQNIRHILIDSIGFDSPQAGFYLEKMMLIDSINQIRMVEILEEYGWLSMSKIGATASSAIFAVIQHSDKETMEKYYPQLKHLAEIGEADKPSAALMEDRLLMYYGKKQIYGSQATTSLRDDDTIVIWPIENPDSVNILRAQVGFETTVEENAARLQAEYNPDEELPE